MDDAGVKRSSHFPKTIWGFRMLGFQGELEQTLGEENKEFPVSLRRNGKGGD